ncbi:SpoIIIAC/SpoIIIAD family protein [Chryseomicrobium sp. FSL W7-1435]|uniref:SpoIIIAC/SpoIIIAD family protein n=1 Tax=Chryseomicrobium sp. FSL W7-1435 TaxID=2921704 RepID=UPI00315A69D1
MGFDDIFRMAGVGILLALLHVFLELNNKSEYSFFISVTAFIYFSIELLRMLKLFFEVIEEYLLWLYEM